MTIDYALCGRVFMDRFMNAGDMDGTLRGLGFRRAEFRSYFDRVSYEL